MTSREALLQAKANQLNAVAEGGRTDWTSEQVLSAIYANNMTLETWFDKFGQFENLGVEYDTEAARQALLANKAAEMTANSTTGERYSANDAAAAIAQSGMSLDEWFLRYGMAEGMSTSYKDTSGQGPAKNYSAAAATLDQREALLAAKAAEMTLNDVTGKIWTVTETLDAINAAGLSLEKWYDLYGKHEDLGVEYDTEHGRELVLSAKAAQLNEDKYLGRSDWDNRSVEEAIKDAGMSVDDWSATYGAIEGINERISSFDESFEKALEAAGLVETLWEKLFEKQNEVTTESSIATNDNLSAGFHLLDNGLLAQQVSTDQLTGTMSGVGSSISGYMGLVQNGLGALSADIKGIDWTVVVNVTSSGSSSNTFSGSFNAPVKRETGTKGVYGSSYKTEQDLLKAKINSMLAEDPGSTNNGRSWTTSNLKQYMADQGLSVKSWYEQYGKLEGFASGGVTPINEPFWVGEHGRELMVAPQHYGVLSNSDSEKLMSGSQKGSNDDSVMSKLISELSEVKNYLRQIVYKTDKTAYSSEKTLGFMRMWDAEGFPARAST